MKKAWIIAWKDTLIRLYDRGALLYLLLTPILMTMLLGTVFGGGNDGAFVPPAVPFTLVNHDGGKLGATFEELFATNAGLREVVVATVVMDEAAARAEVDEGGAACCVVVVPAGFSDAVVAGEPASVTVYSDPTQSISASLVEGVVQGVVAEMQAGTTATRVTIEQMARSGRVRSVQEGEAVAARLNSEAGNIGPLVTIQSFDAQGAEAEFNVLSVIAPGIALLFLAFGTVQGARSILSEEEIGTLARLNTTPTSALSIMVGKLMGIFLVGMLQFAALMLGSSLLFGIRWGDPLAVAVLSVVLVIAFTCLGLLLAVLAKSEGQANSLGTIVSLVFALLGGAFVQRNAFPGWLQTIGLVTPNAWGNDAFVKLGLGQSLEAIVPQLAGLLTMSAIVFTFGVIGYRARTVR